MLTNAMMSAAPLALGPAWLNAETLLNQLGGWALWGAAVVIFAECGLLIGFFLPGDSLLFMVGLLIAAGTIQHSLWFACLLLTAAALVGNLVGYEIGRAAGPAVFKRDNSKIFKREYVEKTHEFFERYGSRAIILARFVPIVRTFITVTAGVGQMDRRRYTTYSTVGAVIWAAGVTLLGALLGQFDFVKKNIEVMLIAIVLVSVVPVAIEFLRERAKQRREPGAAAGAGRHAAGATD